MSRPFTKMQGLGNDFVVFEGPFVPAPSLVAAICDRRRGIGADGVLVVARGGPAPAAVQMGYWNADGSAAEMCGNGLRCAARYARDRNWVDTVAFVVDTPVGPRQVVMGDLVTAELGPVVRRGVVQVDGLTVWLAEVGNPHAVTWVDDLGVAPVTTSGPLLERHPSFPGGTNVEFASTRGRSLIELRVWERGVGETLACGTGAAATAAVAADLGLVDLPVTIRLPGGDLTVDLRDDRAYITGPADTVFAGEWPR